MILRDSVPYISTVLAALTILLFVLLKGPTVVPLLASSPAMNAPGNGQTCPLRGQQFPAPVRLASDDLFNEATQAIEQKIHANLTQSPYNETTFSIGMFSTTDHGLVYQYHHTDQSVANSRTGTHMVGPDSIYRIASISKLLTVYLLLLTGGDRRWNDPVTGYIPELANVNQGQLDYITPDWTEITLGDLAMYLAGAARDYGLNDAAMPNFVTSGMSKMAAETLTDNPSSGIHVLASEDPVCGFFEPNVSYLPCTTREGYLRGISMLGASFPPALTPSYSNANYALLGIALSNMEGKSVEEVLRYALAEPLGLTGTTMNNPPSITKHSVIASGNETSSGWHDALGPLNAAAGAFSTTNDLARIGKSILNHTLISKAVTNRWFSTVTFVDRLDQAVGRAWEIFRKQAGGHTVDIFTKSGNWGGYRSVLAVIPDYDFGFSILVASNRSHQLDETLTKLIGNIVLPALETAAKRQAAANFAGHYMSTSSNTSIVLATDSRPALRLTRYVVHGVDLMKAVFEDFGKDIDFRLVPSQLGAGRNVSFTGIYQPPEPPPPQSEWYWPCQAWLDIDDFTYASVPMGQMVFETDEAGRALSVRLNAFRETLVRGKT